jgi:hypothetical protein
MLKDDLPFILYTVQDRRSANVDLPAGIIGQGSNLEQVLECDKRRIAENTRSNLFC